jgi:Mor family transcriptional regulator
MDDDKYPEILRELRESIAATLFGLGVEQERAGLCAHACAERIRADWGGQLVYINKGQEYDLSARDLEIWRKYNGRNKHQLCREYGITEQWFYKVIKAMRKKETARRQADLFGAPEPGPRRDV